MTANTNDCEGKRVSPDINEKDISNDINWPSEDERFDALETYCSNINDSQYKIIARGAWTDAYCWLKLHASKHTPAVKLPEITESDLQEYTSLMIQAWHDCLDEFIRLNPWMNKGALMNRISASHEDPQ